MADMENDSWKEERVIEKLLFDDGATEASGKQEWDEVIELLRVVASILLFNTGPPWCTGARMHRVNGGCVSDSQIIILLL